MQPVSFSYIVKMSSDMHEPGSQGCYGSCRIVLKRTIHNEIITFLLAKRKHGKRNYQSKHRRCRCSCHRSRFRRSGGHSASKCRARRRWSSKRLHNRYITIKQQIHMWVPDIDLHTKNFLLFTLSKWSLNIRKKRQKSYV
jgi:hypothetical protein